MFRTNDTFDAVRNLINSFPSDLFKEFDFQTGKQCTYPAINVMEKDGEQIVFAQLPGLKKEQLNIEIEKNLLKLSSKTNSETKTEKSEPVEESQSTEQEAQPETAVDQETRKEAENKKVIFSERRQTDFERTVMVPYRIDAENVTAELKNGILTVKLPRTEADKPRKIEIV